MPRRADGTVRELEITDLKVTEPKAHVGLYGTNLSAQMAERNVGLTPQDFARKLTDMQLKRLGYDVCLAANGWNGLELYRREHPDVKE